MSRLVRVYARVVMGSLIVCGLYAEDRLRLVWADSIVVERGDGESIQRLYGGVQLVQGEAMMRCDRAIYREAASYAILSGGVVLDDGLHRLLADEVEYDGTRRLETAYGFVRLESAGRVLTADWLRYDPVLAQATARGRVRIEDLVEKAVLTGDQAMYDRRKDWAWIVGNPTLTRIDTLAGDTLRVFGLRMEAWGKERRVVVEDSVRIQKRGIQGRSRRAEYQSRGDRLILTGSPLLSREGQEMTGDTLDVRLDGLRFAGGTIRGKALIISRETEGNDTLQGRSITLEARQDTLIRVHVLGQAYARFRLVSDDGKEEGVNILTGDGLDIRFEENQVVWLRVEARPGLCEGRYIPYPSPQPQGRRP